MNDTNKDTASTDEDIQKKLLEGFSDLVEKTTSQNDLVEPVDKDPQIGDLIEKI